MVEKSGCCVVLHLLLFIICYISILISIFTESLGECKHFLQNS